MQATFEECMLPVLNDFELYLLFLKSKQKVPLTNDKAVLKSKDLFNLNGELHFKADYVTEKSLQNAYYALDFFYQVAVTSRLAQVYRQEKENYLQINPERLEKFESLSDTEKYFFLLETSWSYINWPKLGETRSWYLIEDSIVKILYLVAASSPGDVLQVKGHRYIDSGKEHVHFPVVLSPIYAFYFLGFYGLEFDRSFTKKLDRYTFPVKALTPTNLGVELTTILLEKRPLNLWNISYRKEWDRGEVPLGISDEQFYTEDKEGYLIPNPEPTFEIEAFLKPFISLFDSGELNESMFPLPKVFMPGAFVFKVALDKDLYRNILISANHTLDDLHLAIQEAYKFDNDHLYAFYMDGESYSDDRYMSPWMDEGPFADAVKIGELDLYVGQRFLYVFDFGDNWHFYVTLLSIDGMADEPEKPKTIEKQGKNPKQYGGF